MSILNLDNAISNIALSASGRNAIVRSASDTESFSGHCVGVSGLV